MIPPMLKLPYSYRAREHSEGQPFRAATGLPSHGKTAKYELPGLSSSHPGCIKTPPSAAIAERMLQIQAINSVQRMKQLRIVSNALIRTDGFRASIVLALILNVVFFPALWGGKTLL